MPSINDIRAFQGFGQQFQALGRLLSERSESKDKARLEERRLDILERQAPTDEERDIRVQKGRAELKASDLDIKIREEELAALERSKVAHSFMVRALGDLDPNLQATLEGIGPEVIGNLSIPTLMKVSSHADQARAAKTQNDLSAFQLHASKAEAPLRRLSQLGKLAQELIGGRMDSLREMKFRSNLQTEQLRTQMISDMMKIPGQTKSPQELQQFVETLVPGAGVPNEEELQRFFEKETKILMDAVMSLNVGQAAVNQGTTQDDLRILFNSLLRTRYSNLEVVPKGDGFEVQLTPEATKQRTDEAERREFLSENESIKKQDFLQSRNRRDRNIKIREVITKKDFLGREIPPELQNALLQLFTRQGSAKNKRTTLELLEKRYIRDQRDPKKVARFARPFPTELYDLIDGGE